MNADKYIISISLLLFLLLSVSCARSNTAEELTAAELDVLPERFTNTLGVEMQLIRGGLFEMGSDRMPYGKEIGAVDGPRHPVYLSPYYIARSEITREQYRAFVDATGMGGDIEDFMKREFSHSYEAIIHEYGDDSFPIVCAPWNLAKAFCDWLAEKEGVAYRLPTEAEWEFMARADTDTYFWWGPSIKKFMCIHRASNRKAIPYFVIAPTRAYPANPWGFYEVYGNAGEWCEDWYRIPSAELKRNPVGRSGRKKVMRGGGYWSLANSQHSYVRQGIDPHSTRPRGGIRLTLPVRAGFTLPQGASLPEPPRPKPEPVITKEPVVYNLPVTDSINMEFIRVDPGTFTMGSPESERGRGQFEGPQTEVTIEQPFYLARYEMTQEQWFALVKEANAEGGIKITHKKYGWDKDGNKIITEKWDSTYVFQEPQVTFKGDRHPIENITYSEAFKLCRYLTNRERAAGRLMAGESYMLPDNHQWEYAARAGSQEKYSFGDDEQLLDHYAWYDGRDGTHEIGQKLPNAWGFYDMHGNVSEWLKESLSKYPGGSVTESDYKHYGNGGSIIVRGGAWNSGAVGCRSAAKMAYDGRYNFIGVRLMRTISEVEEE